MAASLQDILLRVKEGSDIVQIVGQYLPLKRAGGRYLGVCPFHNDRHPSMNVNPRMGIYKCFACGAGGDAIKFVQEYERVGFVEALRLVAAKAGIAIPENLSFGDKGDADKTALAAQANQIALQVYVETLPKSQQAIEYLKSRGLTGETAKQFQIGFAPENPDLILQRAQSKKIPVAAFVEAGILGESMGRVFDRFGGRLIFPIFNLSGRVIGFGGRIMPGKEGAKYVNTPESPLYQKSRVLYGFNFARQSIDQSGEAVIVEGYMDLVSLWQAGIHNAVAVCGTALTKEHAQMLGRFARKVYLFFDGDTAGRNAVRRSLEPLLAQGVEARVPVLPESEDPDSFVRRNSAGAVQSLFTSADDLPAFWVRDRGKSVESLSPEEKDSMLREAAKVLAHNPSADVREEHLQHLRRRLGLKPESVKPQPRSFVSGQVSRMSSIKSAVPGSGLGLFVSGSNISVAPEALREWKLLQMLLAYPNVAGPVVEEVKLEWFSDPRPRELFDHAVALSLEKGDVSLAELNERIPESLRDGLAALELPEGDAPERVRRESLDYVLAMEKSYWQNRKREAKTVEEIQEIQKCIQALNLRR